jgi:5-formyltetrahydrofolate cyclo-ligase
VTALADAKRAARTAAAVARAAAHQAAPGAARQAAGHALAEIGALRVRCVAGYLPIRTEIDPLPAMLALGGLGYRLCVPVIEGPGRPLRFRAWTPEAELAPGPYGVPVPADGDWLDPDALLVPLLAYDRRAFRLGYGGGFYDRTIHDLRGRAPVHAFGFAYAGQRIEAVPHEPTDAPLDGVVTEDGVLRPPLDGAAASI